MTLPSPTEEPGMPEVRPEAAAAAAWWADALGAGVDAERSAAFRRELAERIEARCQDAAWQPEVPTYGSCGRQVVSDPRPDGALARAARAAGVTALLDGLPRAVMWVNPGEVTVETEGDGEPAQVWP
jgi:BTG family